MLSLVNSSINGAYAVRRALSGLTEIGSFGNLVFQVSSQKVKTFETLSRTSTATFADHAVAGRKPVSEFTGLESDQVQLGIVFNVSLGVDPLEEVKQLRRMLSSGTPHHLMIGRYHFGLFTLRSLSEGWQNVSRGGRPREITVDISLSEYIDNLPTQAQEMMRVDEIKRSETGKGGPQRLPGTGNPSQSRLLTSVK